jgi:hypothetical protein
MFRSYASDTCAFILALGSASALIIIGCGA